MSELEGHIIAMRGEAKRIGQNRILLETLELDPVRVEIDKFFVGEMIARQWRPPLRVAELTWPERINRFMENTAVNRGAHYAVFSEREEALIWLLETHRDSATRTEDVRGTAPELS